MKKKKFLTVFLAAIIITITVGAAAADNTSAERQNRLSNFAKTRTYDNTFTDIAGHWAEEHIANAYEYGIVSGTGGDLYNPDGQLTVAQAIVIAAQLHMAYKYSDSGQSVLADYSAGIAPKHWAAPYVTYAEKEGLINNTWGNALDRPVTRAEAIRIFSRILKEKDLERTNTVNSLPDVNLTTPYFAEIALFYEAGIVRGSAINGANNSFNPSGSLSRAEAATISVMIMQANTRISGITYGQKAVSTLAGTGTSGFTDETNALASFTLPYGLAADSKGRIVIFDAYNNAIRLISNEKTETIAGRWITADSIRFSRGFYKDGMLAGALFNRPTSGVYNAKNDLFICDSENHVIRLIRNSRVYTFAGTTRGYADGAGSAAQFNTPMAVAIDKQGILYVADTMNNCIRKIDAKGNVTTIAGMPGKFGYKNSTADESLFNSPSGIAVSDDGSVLYVADTGNQVIRKIENGSVTTLCGAATSKDANGDYRGGYQDGASDKAMFNLPLGLTLAGDILFVADSGNNAIRAVNNTSGYVFTAAGTGEPGDRDGGLLTAEFNQPAGVLWHNGVLYIADTANNLIKTLTVNLAAFRGAE